MGKLLFGEPRQKSAGSTQPSIPTQPKPVQPQHVHPQAFRPNPLPTGPNSQPWLSHPNNSMPAFGHRPPAMHHPNYSAPNMVQGRPTFNAPPPPHFQGALGLSLGPPASHATGMQAMPSGSQTGQAMHTGDSNLHTTGPSSSRRPREFYDVSLLDKAPPVTKRDIQEGYVPPDQLRFP